MINGALIIRKVHSVVHLSLANLFCIKFCESDIHLVTANFIEVKQGLNPHMII